MSTGLPGQVYKVLDDFRDTIDPELLKNSPMLDQLFKMQHEFPGLRSKNNTMQGIQEKCFRSIFWVQKDNKHDRAREL